MGDIQLPRTSRERRKDETSASAVSPSIQANDMEPIDRYQNEEVYHSEDNDHNAGKPDSITETRMRRKLRFFFMNPIEKYQAKGRVPLKLGLQVIKIFLVTAQLVLFGYDSYSYQQQHRDTTIALHHMFLKSWDSVREIASYPPAAGPYAVYTKKELYQHLDHVVHNFANITEGAIGSFGYDNDTQGEIGDLYIYKTFYRKGHIWPFNETLIFDNSPVTRHLILDKLYPANDPRWHAFESEKYLKAANFTIMFERLIKIAVRFNLKTVYLKSLSRFDLPDCYRLEISIVYDNSVHDGQIPVSLISHPIKLSCHTNVKFSETSKIEYVTRQCLNVAVILLCIASLILCARSLLRGQALRRRTEFFFITYYNRQLTAADRLDFVDFWYVMIIFNDILIIIGSLLKIQLEQKIIDGTQYNFCSTLLGSGNLLVWAGVLRYLGFFNKYNILILTLKRAMPNILRFLLCAMLLYAGFCFCGWVVLGPHHIKFRSLSSTSECLFALMNGDDMFATFAIMGETDGVIWWFARFYLYTFLILFIYCVISLFLSVIMDSYETIREIHDPNLAPGDLQRFIMECQDDASSGAFRSGSFREPTSAWVLLKNTFRRYTGRAGS